MKNKQWLCLIAAAVFLLALGAAVPPFVTAFMRTVLDDGTAAEARATLGIDASIGDGQFVDRGDPAAYDWTEADLTLNGNWHDLDCSGVAPAGATAILFNAIIEDDAANSVFKMRENGASNEINAGAVRTQVADLPNDKTFIIACNYAQIVEYWATNVTWTSIDLVVSGWWTARHRITDETGDTLTAEDGEAFIVEG